MSQSIRIMLCDDSSTMRRLMKKALSSETNFEVVYEAKDGRDAVNHVNAANPDVIVMDIEMPVMDGIDATRAIRRKHPKLPIIIFSSLTSTGAEATLDAMAAGANDFALKPTAAGHIQNALSTLQATLIPMIRSLGSEYNAASRKETSRLASRNPSSTQEARSRKQTKAIAIGVSTGGPEALATLLGRVKSNPPVPVFIAQHMPPVFTTRLAKRLSEQTGHTVVEAAGSQRVVPGTVYIAPGDFHMRIVKRGSQAMIKLSQDPHVNSCRPAVDPLFQSCTEVYGAALMGIVLTGMGKDGTEGARGIKSAGGTVLVQDESSSVVWGMPRKVAESGLADEVLDLNDLAEAMNMAFHAQRNSSSRMAVKTKA